jgi:tricorn protease
VPLGYLGIDFKPVLGGFEVTRVIANAPADRNVSRLAPGDVIRAVNGAPLAAPGAMPSTDLLAALQGTVGQETLLDLAPRAGQKPEASATRHVLITPISAATDGVLRYQDSVIENARKVREWSGGRLGYLHIRGMDLASARDFERDLFAAAQGKDGLLIDVRDNGGGSTADILLSSLTAPRHATTFARGQDLNTLPNDAYPRDRRLIYGYSRPISVLINQNSFSNAEIFAHAIKTIGRGKLVGTATFGGVISTGSYGLIDGTTIRTPFRGWWLPGDVDMENNGAKPDVPVPQNPEDEASGEDRQLEAAVKELLSRAK